MSETTYYPDGNRDFRRWIEGTVPEVGLMGSSLLYMASLPKIGGHNPNLTNRLVRDSIAKDPRLKVNQFGGNYNKNIFSDFMKARQSGYWEGAHKVQAPKGNYGIMAHELGHAEQYRNPTYKKVMGPLTKIGKKLAPLGFLGPMFLDKEEDAKKSAIAAGAMQAPVLYEEIDASRRGAKMIRKGMGGSKAISNVGKMGKFTKALQGIRAFAGVPSYMLAAAAPYLFYKYYKSRGLYEGDY